MHEGVPTVAILGLGRAGRALRREFVAASVPLIAVWNRSRREDPTVRSGDPSVAARSAKVWLVCVSDDALPVFVANLRPPEGTIVLHTSGSMPLSRMTPPPSVHLGGWHPLQSFASRGSGVVPVPPYCVALDGDEKAVDAGRALATATGHPAVEVRGDAKAAYHAAAVLASNTFVALESAAVRVMVSAGVAPSDAWTLLRPLVHGTLDNLQDGRFTEALTGPLARGDADTVRRNLAACAGIDGADAIYRSLGREAVRLADLPASSKAALEHALLPSDEEPSG